MSVRVWVRVPCVLRALPQLPWPLHRETFIRGWDTMSTTRALGITRAGLSAPLSPIRDLRNHGVPRESPLPHLQMPLGLFQSSMKTVPSFYLKLPRSTDCPAAIIFRGLWDQALLDTPPVCLTPRCCQEARPWMPTTTPRPAAGSRGLTPPLGEPFVDRSGGGPVPWVTDQTFGNVWTLLLSKPS